MGDEAEVSVGLAAVAPPVGEKAVFNPAVEVRGSRFASLSPVPDAREAGREAPGT